MAKTKCKANAWVSYAEYLLRQKRYGEAQNYFILAANDLYYLDLAKAYKGAACAAVGLGDAKKAKAYLRRAHAFAQKS